MDKQEPCVDLKYAGICSHCDSVENSYEKLREENNKLREFISQDISPAWLPIGVRKKRLELFKKSNGV